MTTEIYTLSLHDALPISPARSDAGERCPAPRRFPRPQVATAASHGRSTWWASSRRWTDRKSTRLNSSHRCISYAVFCLKKKKKKRIKKQYKCHKYKYQV